MDKLQEFHFDKEMLEVVKAFMLNNLELEAVSRVMGREDVSGLADAKEVIENTFDKLDEIYEIKNEKEGVNQAK